MLPLRPLVDARTAEAGDLVDPATLPADVVKAGGGWVDGRYFTTGAHKDGRSGWLCSEVRGTTPLWARGNV